MFPSFPGLPLACIEPGRYGSCLYDEMCPSCLAYLWPALSQAGVEAVFMMKCSLVSLVYLWPALSQAGMEAVFMMKCAPVAWFTFGLHWARQVWKLSLWWNVPQLPGLPLACIEPGRCGSCLYDEMCPSCLAYLWPALSQAGMEAVFMMKCSLVSLVYLRPALSQAGMEAVRMLCLEVEVVPHPLHIPALHRHGQTGCLLLKQVHARR